MLNKRQELIIRNRMACMIYGQIVFWYSAVEFVNYIEIKYRCGHLSHCLCDAPNTDKELFLLRFVFGYLIYDLFALTSSGLTTLSSVIHHVTCMVAIYIVLCRQTNASYIVMGMFVLEISNMWR